MYFFVQYTFQTLFIIIIQTHRQWQVLGHFSILLSSIWELSTHENTSRLTCTHHVFFNSRCCRTMGISGSGSTAQGAAGISLHRSCRHTLSSPFRATGSWCWSTTLAHSPPTADMKSSESSLRSVVFLSILSAHPYVCVSVYLSVHPSSFLSLLYLTHSSHDYVSLI